MRQVLGMLIVLEFAAFAFASPTTPGTIKTYSTTQSIGIEWPITGDANHNAACSTQYRISGSSTWKKALPLFRVDMPSVFYGSSAYSKGPFNMFAGSILFLEQNTTYEVKLDILDPDGGSTSRTFSMKTRATPVLPTSGRTFHVATGSGGGDGSSGNPFKGMAAAEAQATAGDIFLLHAGSYGSYTFTKSGSANGQYIAWKAAGDGQVRFTKLSAASYLWIEGLTIANDNSSEIGLSSTNTSTDVVVIRNQISGYHYCICAGEASRAWYIADNVIVGNHAATESNIDGEGIQLFGQDHEVAHNSITYTSDAISCYGGTNCDFYGNDIFDISDDGIEPDYSYANIRAWENRITNAYNSAFSLQPMFGAPWYFVKNQIFGSTEPLKLRLVDRFLLAQNTFFTMRIWNQEFAQLLFSGTVKNNLWIYTGCGWGALWQAAPESLLTSQSRISPYYASYWKTDVDYNGFDWSGIGGSYYPFMWYDGSQNRNYSDVQNFSAAAGIERHGIRVNRDQIFQSYSTTYVSSSPCRYTAPVQYLTLKSGTNTAIDAGIAMPNINDGFTGSAPDLGAYECGVTPVHYGPRHLSVRGGQPAATACAPISSIGNIPNTTNNAVSAKEGIVHLSGMVGTLAYHLNRPASVKARILDQRGRTIREFEDRYQTEGTHRISMEGQGRTASEIPNGIYLLQLSIGSQSFGRKVVLVR